MNSTGNFQLNQWDLEDRILRTDFNSDNEKIDAALKGQAEALAAETAAREQAVAGVQQSVSTLSILTPIKTVSISKSASSVRVPLDDVDWNQWQAVVLDAMLLSSNFGTVQIKNPFGDLTGSAQSTLSTWSAAERYGPSRMILFCNKDACSLVNSLCIYFDSTEFFNPGARFNTTTYVDYAFANASNTLSTGTTIKVWGIR